MRWRIDVKPIHDIIVSFLTPTLGPRVRYRNFAGFIEECYRSQLYPYIDFPYDTLYDMMVKEGANFDDAEAIVTHCRLMVGQSLHVGPIQEMCSDNDFDLHVSSDGYINIYKRSLIPPSEEEIRKDLMADELRSYEYGDYIPPRQRLAW